MSADLLRRAATRLRESAIAATPGPWAVERRGGEPFTEFALRSRAEFQFAYEAEITAVLTPDDEWPDLDYFALMHPPVALALADWLDFAARASSERAAIEKQIGMQPGDLTSREEESALAVARAVLREDGT